MGEDAEVLASAVKMHSTTMHKVVEGNVKYSVYKGVEEVQSFEGVANVDAMKSWAAKARVPAFGQTNEENFDIYTEGLASKEGLVWVCVDPKSKEEEVKKVAPAIVSVASKVTQPFVWLDIEAFEDHAREELGCKDYPTVVFQRGDLLGDREDAKVEKFVRSFAEKPEEFTTEVLGQWFDDIVAGKVEAVPEPDELEGLDDDDEDEKEDEDEDEKEAEPEAKEEL